MHKCRAKPHWRCRLLTPEQGRLEKIILPGFRYSLGYAESNNIDAAGCQHLSKADWKNLSSLDLSKPADMQTRTKLVLMAVNT